MMVNAPFISVCIPTYNRASMLPAAIESVLNQTYSNFELLILDNHSTDNTPAVIQQYHDSRIRVIRNETTVGMFENHNLCIKHAQAKWLVFIHSDETCHPHALQTFCDAILQDDGTAGIILPAFDREILRSLSKLSWYGSRIRTPHTLALTLNGIGPPSVVAFKRETLETVHGFSVDPDMCYYGDHDIYARLADSGCSFLLVSSPIESRQEGSHRASFKLEQSADSELAIVRFVQYMARRHSWPQLMNFLKDDICHWPTERALWILREIAIAGLRKEFKDLISTCSNRNDILQPRQLLTIKLANLVGPKFFLSMIKCWRQFRNIKIK